MGLMQQACPRREGGALSHAMPLAFPLVNAQLDCLRRVYLASSAGRLPAGAPICAAVGRVRRH